MLFEDFVQRRGTHLLRVAYLLTRDPQLAEDLVQSVLLEAYRKWSRVSKARDADAYVQRMLVNTYLNWTRRRSWHEQPVPDHLIHGSGPSGESTGETAVLQAERMRELLGGLPPRARVVLVLRYYLDLDDTAIAEYLGITPSSVRATASRALGALRADINPSPSMKESP